MKSRSGLARLACMLFGFALAAEAAGSALAKDDEVISDPELAQTRRLREPRRTPREAQSDAPEADQPEWEGAEEVPAQPQQLGRAADEEVISDPELESKAGTVADDRTWGGVVPDAQYDAPASAGQSEHDPTANTGISRLELIGQQGIDLHHEGDLEDAYESRLRFDAEIDFRRSRKLRISVGTRVDLLWALPARNDPDLTIKESRTHPARQDGVFEQDRWELDILPLSAFADTTLGDSFHLRVGEQPVSIRRMDFYSPIDILAAFDMRGQPKLDPASGRLAQPALRADWDLSSWATLQMVYVPWFLPNLNRANRDRYVAKVLGTQGANSSQTIESLIDPSYQTKISETGLRFVGPAPDFTTPQGQARLTMRGSGFEIGLSGGTALEKIPAVYLTPTAEAYAQGKDRAAVDALFMVGNERPLLDVEYHRYATFGIDGSLDLAPLSLAFELAFSPARHLNAATADSSHLPQPNVSEPIVDPSSTDFTMLGNVRDKSIRKGVPLVQAAFHVDWISGETFAIAAEGFLVKAMQLPYDLTRDWWGFIPNTGIYAGGLVGGTYRPNPDDGRWRLDLSLISLVGPSLIVTPQVEWKATEAFYLNVGAQIFEGPKPTLGGAQNVNVGGLLSGYDQVFMGFRYLP
jgi:hypothetical protein